MILSALSKREKRALYFTVIVVLSSLLYNFVLEPIGKKWVQLDREIVTREVRLKKNLRVVKQKQAIELEYARYADYIRMQGSDEEEIAKLLSGIEKLARDSAVHITDIRPLVARDLSFYKKFAIEIECEAPIEALTKFIYALQTSSQLLKVEKLQLNTKSGQPESLRSFLLVTRVLIP